MKIGIVGLGAHGLNHAAVLDRLGCTLVGIDADLSARDRFESQFDADSLDSPDALTDDVEAVVIATPNKFHEPAAVDALEAGFDVLIEKPLAHTLESAERIAKTARNTDAMCAVSFSNKFQTACSVAKSYVNSGYFGDVTHVRARHIRRRGIPGRGTWYTSKNIAGGGALLDIGANLVNVLLYLIGWPETTEVLGASRSEFGKQDDYAYLEMYGDDGQAKMYDVEDSVTAFCKFEDGTTATIEVAWAANARPEHTYVLQGTEAGAELELSNNLSSGDGTPQTNHLRLLETRSGKVDHHADSTVTVPDRDPLEAEMKQFLSAVDSEEQPELNSVDQALAVQRTIDDIYRASR